MAFRLLSWVVTERHAGMRPDLQLQLSALVRASLGDPAYYEDTVDKTRLPPLAEALGIRMPPYAVVTNIAAAETFIARHPYPVGVEARARLRGTGCGHLCRLRRAGGRF